MTLIVWMNEVKTTGMSVTWKQMAFSAGCLPLFCGGTAHLFFTGGLGRPEGQATANNGVLQGVVFAPLPGPYGSKT